MGGGRGRTTQWAAGGCPAPGLDCGVPWGGKGCVLSVCAALEAQGGWALKAPAWQPRVSSARPAVDSSARSDSTGQPISALEAVLNTPTTAPACAHLSPGEGPQGGGAPRTP